MYLVKQEIFKLVRSNKIQKASSKKCIDCGIVANCYDHRDYLKTFEIEPVCWSCNKKRGPGLNAWKAN